MIKIYYNYGFNETREYRLVKQGLENNSRVEFVGNMTECDFIFQLAYHHKSSYPKRVTPPPMQTVIIDYHDNPRWVFVAEEDKKRHWKKDILQGKHKHNGLAYFKRAWVDIEKKPISWPDKFYPITFAIMDEFIIEEDIKRDLELSCSLRSEVRNMNRLKVLELLEQMKIKGKTQIGRFNKGAMDGFNDNNMRSYFNLLKRSRIVVTCNPDKWEGDHRMWEAFANGALVFVDRMYTPLVHPLVDGVHCVFYDLSDRGLRKLKEKISWYLEMPRQVEKIAKEGHEFAMKYHRASNRVDEILDVIT